MTSRVESEFARWLTESASRTFRRRMIFVAIATIVSASLAQVSLVTMPSFPVDDAYITLHNAQALNAGRDIVFPHVSPLYGATSVVHLGLVASLGWLMPVPWALWGAGWIAVLLYAGAILRLSRLFELSPFASIAFGITALTAGEIAVQLMNGLETGLALAALTWTLALLLDPDGRSRPWLPLLAGQLPFLRPELGLFSILALLELGWQSPRERRLGVLLRSFGWAALSASPWMISYWISSGAPVPPTVAAKRNYFAEGCKPLDWKFSTVSAETWDFVVWLGATAVGFLALPLRRLGGLALLFVAVFLGAYFVEFPGALGHFEHRYLTILQPLALVGFLFAVRSRGRTMRRVALGALAIAAAWSLSTLPSALSVYQRYLAVDTKSSEEVTAVLSSQVPPDARILVHDIGYLSAYVKQPLIDFVGVKWPRAADLHRRITWPSCGDARPMVVSELARESGAEYLVVLDEWDGIFDITRGLRAGGWTLAALRPPETRYQVYRLRASGDGGETSKVPPAEGAGDGRASKP